jgi:3,4-dihydroxy 2-butanone 4-phosphate synthase / GTP cyclohydrolase II
MKKTAFATIDDAVRAFRDGQMIIVVDDEDRENESDRRGGENHA